MDGICTDITKIFFFKNLYNCESVENHMGGVTIIKALNMTWCQVITKLKLFLCAEDCHFCNDMKQFVQNTKVNINLVEIFQYYKVETYSV